MHLESNKPKNLTQAHQQGTSTHYNRWAEPMTVRYVVYVVWHSGRPGSLHRSPGLYLALPANLISRYLPSWNLAVAPNIDRGELDAASWMQHGSVAGDAVEEEMVSQSLEACARPQSLDPCLGSSWY